jgi:hypothetical protein
MNAEPFSISTARLGRIAVLWRPVKRRAAVVDAVPVVYEDDVVDAVRAQLATLDGVLVWFNPSTRGATAPISTRCCGRSRPAGAGSVPIPM